MSRFLWVRLRPFSLCCSLLFQFTLFTSMMFGFYCFQAEAIDPRSGFTLLCCFICFSMAIISFLFDFTITMFIRAAIFRLIPAQVRQNSEEEIIAWAAFSDHQYRLCDLIRWLEHWTCWIIAARANIVSAFSKWLFLPFRRPEGVEDRPWLHIWLWPPGGQHPVQEPPQDVW